MTMAYMVVQNHGLGASLFQSELINAYKEVYYYESSLLKINKDDFTPGLIDTQVKKLVTAAPYFILAKEGDDVVGVLSVRPDDIREIQTLFVKESHRRKGVGKGLIEQFQIIISNYMMKVECLRRNQGAIKFYEKLGFQFTEKARYPLNLVGLRELRLGTF